MRENLRTAVFTAIGSAASRGPAPWGTWPSVDTVTRWMTASGSARASSACGFSLVSLWGLIGRPVRSHWSACGVSDHFIPKVFKTCTYTSEYTSEMTMVIN